MGDPIRAALERLIDRMMNERASSASVDAWAAEARAALATSPADPPAVPEEPTDEELMDAYWRAFHETAPCGAPASWLAGLRAVANLSRPAEPTTPPAPAAPAAGEAGELMAWLRETGQLLSRRPDIQCRVDLRLFERTAALLEQLSAAQALRAEAVDGWRPIKTAPKDGTEIWASDYDVIEIVSWSWDAWGSRDGSIMYPAWWQPLPDHPPLPTSTPAGGEEGV